MVKISVIGATGMPGDRLPDGQEEISTSVCRDTICFPLGKRKYYAGQAIIGSGIPHTIFCPTRFMEVLPKYVQKNKAFVFGKQPNLYHFIAADDYARMVSIACPGV